MSGDAISGSSLGGSSYKETGHLLKKLSISGGDAISGDGSGSSSGGSSFEEAGVGVSSFSMSVLSPSSWGASPLKRC